MTVSLLNATKTAMQITFSIPGPIRLLRFILCAALLLAGCTSYIPREKSYLPLNGDSPEEAIKVVTIPLPVIAASPNEGVTTGALTAFLVH
ncbi:MAG: hypothetical protein WA003_17110, partial [Desulfuromonadaceae bacterium]